MSQTFSLNNSTSKQNYSFSKSQRFKTDRAPTNVAAYEVKDVFKINRESGAGKAFGAIDRFGYYMSPRDKNGIKPNPSPANYKIPGKFGTDVAGNNVNGPNKEYSFGVSRD
jgi:hypothetical protein